LLDELPKCREAKSIRFNLVARIVPLHITQTRFYAFSETVLRKNGPFGAVESSREAVVL
jgi:hypothetical protein